MRFLKSPQMASALLLAAFFLWHPPWAQAAGSLFEKEPQLTPTEAVEKAYATAKTRREDLGALEKTLERTSGIIRGVTEKRLFKAKKLLLESELALAERLLAPGVEGKPDMEKYRAEAKTLLAAHPNIIRETFERIDLFSTEPKGEVPAIEQAAILTKLDEDLAEVQHLFELSIRSSDLAGQLGLEEEAGRGKLKESLRGWSSSVSVLLELAIERSRGLEAVVQVLPDDAELAARADLSDRLVQILAGALADAAELMKGLGMNTDAITEQVLAVTGKVTSDTLDIGVMRKLVSGWGRRITALAIQDGPDIILNILLFLAIVFLTFKLARLAEKVAGAAIRHSSARLSTLLERMTIYIAGKTILIIGLLIALSQLGISLGPLLAGFGIAGFIVGFALQDTLSNFASGIMILIYRPYDVGDLIDTNSIYGRVSQMSLVNTTILTLDNQTIVIPNNKIWGDVIKNVTAQNIRRVDLFFGISYGDDIPKAERVLKEVLAADERVLKDPEPIERVHELGDSSVNFAVWPWVKTADYWETYWGVTRAVKMSFDANNISIPFPQRDVHLDGDVLVAKRQEEYG